MTRFNSALARTTALTTVAIAMTLTIPSLHAEEIVDLDAITVTANREATAVDKSGSTVEVIEEAQIREAGEVRLIDFLNTLPGISVSTNGPAGTTSTLRIRGAAGAYIGVYIDGMNVNDPSSTQISFDWANLTTADVCRIEVLKGAQSALYGSSAIAGVINITTNRATEQGVTNRYAAEIGSYNTARLSFNSSYLGQRGSFAATLSHVTSDGFSAADENDGNTEADGTLATRLSFAGEYDVTDTLTVGAAGFWQKTEGDFDGYYYNGTSYVLGDGNENDWNEAEQLGLRAFARLTTGAVQNEFAVQYYRNDRTSYSDGYATPFLGERSSLSYVGTVPLGATFDLSFGGDATRESYEGSSEDAEYKTYGIFTEGKWSPTDQLDIVGSLRHDDHSTFGGHTSGRLSVAYRPSEDLILRFAGGTGFRAPSLYELYSAYYGNPDLDPETSETYELGIEKRLGETAFLKATLFHTEITDLIQWSSSTYTYQQVEGTSTMEGVELSGGYTLTPTLRLTANYTYTKAHDADGDRLVRVPLHDFNVSLNADLSDRMTAALSVQRVIDTVDSSAALPDYTLVNVNFGYMLNKQTEAYVRVENLLDEEYQTVTGYGTSDRAIYFGVRGTF